MASAKGEFSSVHWERWGRWTSIVSLIALAAPVVVAIIRAGMSGWVPIGDSAYFTARSLDVGTSHHPLLGAWSSGSLDYAEPVNSLGPLQLYLLAPFTYLNAGVGTALGVGLVQLVAMGTSLWLVARTFGTRGVIAASVGLSWLCWLMGPNNLIAAVQHPYLILPFLTTLVATWASLKGDLAGPVAFVAFGSLCAQTHLSYVPLVTGLGLIVVAGVVITYRRAGDEPDAGADERRRTVRVAAGSATLGLVLWLPVLIDQLAGRGNLGAALTQRSGDEPSTGLRLGNRIIATIIGQSITYGRNGFNGHDLRNYIVSGRRGVVTVIVLGAAIVAAVVAWRHGRRALAAWAGIAGTVLALMIWDASMIPATSFGYRADNYRWVWSWLGFAAIGIVVAADGWLSTATVRGRHWAPIAFTVVTIGFSAGTLAARGWPDQAAYDSSTAEISALSDALGEYLDDHDIDGPVVIDDTHLYFGAPYNYPLAVVLRTHGVDYRFLTRPYGYRFGQDRVADGTEQWVITIWVHDEALAHWDEAIVTADGFEPVALTLEQLVPAPTPSSDSGS